MIQRALKDDMLGWRMINSVVLVGASTRIPMKKKILRDFFGVKDLNSPTNHDEDVAYGGAVQATNLSDVKSDVSNNILLLDVNPLTIGIEMADVMTKLFTKEKPHFPLTEE
ncbi:heat shock 70 kDa protein-like [Strongylocentrotus purpuratus]|uniref:Uncharacterized protein n=1 Tax=Strongylocentrotus purpuratus TaxID=7668 RepID=A0A7M7HH58_STRPU|nr:heat shock 70 kDa protein-like [Strongylocentrotus purpuratus]|eukprot:XP_011666818.1 PREDICTED: heat shock 70 kDa protein-like [Strongylocentrotus purpuratus]